MVAISLSSHDGNGKTAEGQWKDSIIMMAGECDRAGLASSQRDVHATDGQLTRVVHRDA